MITVPADTPVTVPDVEPTVATEVLPLVQWPPPVASPKDSEEATQTGNSPDMEAGNGLTVIVVVAVHPVPGMV